MRQYWVNSGEGAQGPFDESAIQRMAASGELSRSANICPVGSESWVPISTLLDGAGGAPPSRPNARRIPAAAIAALGAMVLACVMTGAAGWWLMSRTRAPSVAARAPDSSRSRLRLRALAPTIHEASGTTFERDGDVYARLEVRTEPGVEVTFGARSSMWPPVQMVVADAEGLARYEPPSALRFLRGRPELASVTAKRPGPRASRATATITLEQPFHLSCNGPGCSCVGGATCRVYIARDGRVQASGDAGIVVHVAESSATLGDDTWSVDLTSEAEDAERLRAAFAREAFEATYPVRVEAPGEEPLVGSITLDHESIYAVIRRAMIAARSGQGVEGIPRATGNAILWPRGRRHETIGAEESLSDIRYVGALETERREAGCGAYRDARTGAQHTVTRIYTDAVVTLYDVRSGRRAHRTTIRAPSVSCPRQTRNRRSTSRYRGRDVRRWLERKAR